MMDLLQLCSSKRTALSLTLTPYIAKVANTTVSLCVEAQDAVQKLLLADQPRLVRYIEWLVPKFRTEEVVDDIFDEIHTLIFVEIILPDATNFPPKSGICDTLAPSQRIRSSRSERDCAGKGGHGVICQFARCGSTYGAFESLYCTD